MDANIYCDENRLFSLAKNIFYNVLSILASLPLIFESTQVELYYGERAFALSLNNRNKASNAHYWLYLLL
jgi:hypothetical protein